MLKAVFIDYTGTTVMEGGEEMKTAVLRICQNSMIQNPKDVMKIWWSLIKEYEEICYQETFATEEEFLDKAFRQLEKKYKLKDDMNELKNLVKGYWVNAPIFPDVKQFYHECPLPLYVITNIGVQYVEKAMEKNDLTPSGIVCADMVRAYKPHVELFEKALEVAGCKADEVIHIGDSYMSDVVGARAAGIKPILLQRNDDKEYDDELIVVKSLTEILELIK